MFCGTAAADDGVLSQLRDAALSSDAAYDATAALVAAAPYRFAGSENGHRSVQWALAEMRKLGLKKVRAEPVRLPRWERGPIGVQLLGAAVPQELEAVALGGSVATPRGGITAPVLMVDSIAALKALPLSEVKGRIVFYNGRMARRADGSGYRETVPQRVLGPAEAGRRGAVAVVIRSLSTRHDRLPHTGSLRYDEAAPKVPAAALSMVDADLLEQRVREGGAKLHLELAARDHGHAQGANVIGEIPGSGEGIVLLVAHLDSWDITPGANDDGAGVGILLGTARNLLALGGKPQRTIRFLLTANEEFGLSGAHGYAKRHASELARHQLALESDFGSGAVQQVNGGLSAADWDSLQPLAPLLQSVGASWGENGKGGGADTGPLHERGVPVLGPRQDGTNYFDVHHSSADTVETLDRAGLRQNLAVYSMLAWTAAQAPPYARMPFTAAD